MKITKRTIGVLGILGILFIFGSSPPLGIMYYTWWVRGLMGIGAGIGIIVGGISIGLFLVWCFKGGK